MKSKKLVIIMPAYNEASVIGSVLQKTVELGYKNIVIVDDGSKDHTAQIAAAYGATVLTHPVNRGLGAALATGMLYAFKQGAAIAVTLDSDGQHDPRDIMGLIKPIINGKADVVIGSRLHSPKGMPWYRIFGNWILNGITWLLFGILTTDSQSGLRAFSRRALEKITIRTSRMEVSSEIFAEIKRNNLRFKEYPIQAIYTDYSLRKGQSNLNAFSIIRRLVFRVLAQL